MNIVCLICSELLNNGDAVSTKCGHVFDRLCLTNWLVNHDTCPTCREKSVTSSGLIKLFFEVDDNKRALNIDEILVTNDGLIVERRNLRLRAAELQSNVTDLEHKMRETLERNKILERQKQLDDMALAGFRGIKEEYTKEIVKLSENVQNLKLDLLAERQIRRIQQQSLRSLDPQNIDYDPDSVTSEESKSVDSVENSRWKLDVPFWKLNCEAKLAIKSSDSKPPSTYLLPSKIQKAAEKETNRTNDKFTAFRSQRSVWSKNEKKPAGFHFIGKGTPSSSSAESSLFIGPSPSTSTCSPPANRKTTFGSRSLIVSQPSANPFRFSMGSPTFNFTQQDNSSGFTFSCPIQKKKDKNHDSGPKSSDR